MNNKINDYIQQIENLIICPITLKIMMEPCMITSCGHTFEKIAILQILSQQSNGCPFCRTPFNISHLSLNILVKDIIEQNMKLIKNIDENKYDEMVYNINDINDINNINDIVIIKHTDGSKYEGTLKGLMKHGKGTLMYATGAKYIGDWVDGYRCGSGVFYYTNKSECLKYEGEWDNNIANGYGTLTFKNGNKYEGFWKDDKRNGTGLSTNAILGKKSIGVWKNDELEYVISELKN